LNFFFHLRIVRGESHFGRRNDGGKERIEEGREEGRKEDREAQEQEEVA
jgi:hypothetical protein